MSEPGHVYVVHGQLQAVTCDAILLPTDSSFRVEPHWHDVLGGVPSRPAGWTENGRSDIDPFWFVDVTDDDQRVRDPQLIRDRLAGRVDQIITHLASKAVVRGRARHLVAMPLLASGSGGQLAMTMVRALLDELDALTKKHPLDFAIVVPERETFEALQRHRRRGLDPRPGDLAVELGLRARRGELSLMIGAGVSMGAGLPSWNGLLEAVTAKVAPADRDSLIIEQASSAPDETHTAVTPPAQATFSTAFKTLAALDQAQLVEALLGTSLGQEVVASLTSDAEHKRRPALGHLLLAGLQCRQVATTNYDDLYETAVRSQRGGGIAKLPYERPTHGQPWILKMHGDVEHEDDIVLTRTSFIAYDGRHRPAGSVFQSMLMTSHVLFVGVSLTDDNILRLTHEVAHYVNTSGTQNAGPDRNLLGTVLTLAPDPHRERLWRGNLTWRAAGQSIDDRINARDLEILLDKVAMWAVGDEPAASPRRPVSQ